MTISRAAGFVALLAIGSMLAAAMDVAAQASTPPSSLRYDLGSLYPQGSGTQARLNGTAPANSRCSDPLLPNTAGGRVTATFRLPEMPFPRNGTQNGSVAMYHIIDAIDLKVSFTAGTDQGGASTSGMRVEAELSVGPEKIVAPAAIVGPSAQTPGQQTLRFTAPENGTVSHDGTPIALTIALASNPPAMGGAPLPAQNVALQCGSGTVLGPVIVYRGMPAEGDLDGDGIPDREDADRDGDGVPNDEEEQVECNFGGQRVNIANRGDITPGRDSDGDGVNDEDECAAGFDPTSAASFPPAPRTIGDILAPFILLLVVLALIAGLGFVYLKFGKTVQVTVASSPELFIPPGQKGKYEIQVANVAKKGEPRTYQLLVEGMPEGWDAKLNKDHVTLEPAGGAQSSASVWLEVESPEHQEPESAVVVVKAVPLNKAGRKDTLRLGSKAETITSINVPPGSKVPVKRGGKIESAEPAEEEAPAAAAVTLADLGLDAASVKKLAAAKITDAEALRTADAAALHKKTKISDANLTAWQQAADLVRLGMSGEQASALVGAGITSMAALAEAEPKTVAEKAGVDEKTGKSWVKAASKWLKKHKQEAPEAAPAKGGAPAAVPEAAGAAKPALQVGGLKHEPPSFHTGETVKSSVSVANNGGASSTIKLSLYVNDGLADVQTVTVKAGKSKEVHFKWTAQERNKLNIRGELVPS